MPSGKRMQTKAERRAEHNAIERARRENLNTKFQQLAHSLPNLQNDRRPSKGTIIERTLDFVKNTVMKEEKFESEIRKLRQEHEELMRQLNHGYQSTSTTASTHGSASDADESDGSSTSSRGVYAAVDRLSLNSTSCPSLEMSNTSPPMQPSSGLDSSNFMSTASSYNMLSTKNPVQNDVMFGQQQDPEQQQQQMMMSATITYESDDDYSSANLEDMDPSSANDFTSTYPSMVTMPPSTDYMDKMTTPSPAPPIPSSDYEYKFEQAQH
ncbi:hypothetical protein BDA99DRAFT_102808 [Phascolomyces articulosus]|uniref:BHLH domain-containing protein n=1 Tax=Phascolomyces articulosus TaxID=60185 RepID=A0AAD5PCQ7_9FUNG|nr:hypothetical protein BDA99DRAFT_102808 [Phascolomyces articulosus]